MSERTESGRSEIQDARMVARAIENGWINPPRWETQKPKQQLIEEIKQRGDVTLAQRATLAVHELLEHEDHRPKGIGVRCVVAMERQNQIDDLSRKGLPGASIPETGTTEQVTNNVQINFYLPTNGRESAPIESANGHCDSDN